MAQGSRRKRASSKSNPKVGSSPRAARKTGGRTDFGVPASRSTTEFAHRKSRETKFNPTTSHPKDPRQEIGATQQARVSGVGKSNAGPGGASAGDIDPDVIGVGSGSGLAQSPADPHNVSNPEWSRSGQSRSGRVEGPPARSTNPGASRNQKDLPKPNQPPTRRSRPRT